MASPVTRRGFLQVTTGAGALASIAPRIGPLDTRALSAPGQAIAADAGWFDRPMRWLN